MPDIDYDAILRNWTIIFLQDSTQSGLALTGQIFADRTGRFGDSRWIMTSQILTPPNELVDEKIAVTRNSRYLLMGTVH